MDWATLTIGEAYDHVSPAGVAEIRLLPSFEQGELAHARARAGRPSRAARLSGIGEMFYVLTGKGELWRKTGGLEDVTPLVPGRSVSLLPEIEYQYRAVDGPLDFLVFTAPRWQRENWHEAEHSNWDDEGRVVSTAARRPGPWLTVDLPSEYDYLAPDGSEIRLLGSYDAGGLAHCRLPPGNTSSPVRHRTVVEVWYVSGGRGEVWRAAGDAEEAVDVAAGTALSIPAGTSFQFRATGDEPLEIVIGTFPRWPGADEAQSVEGRWAHAAI
jgi:mannose-6-phosphate isomerase-like protein (cupin superfamily)